MNKETQKAISQRIANPNDSLRNFEKELRKQAFRAIWKRFIVPVIIAGTVLLIIGFVLGALIF